METTALRLYNLLDDIDTLDDACKSNDAAFRKHAYERQQKRHELADTDGYTVTWKRDKQPEETEYLTPNTEYRIRWKDNLTGEWGESEHFEIKHRDYHHNITEEEKSAEEKDQGER
jgi:hypothetical protein